MDVAVPARVTESAAIPPTVTVAEAAALGGSDVLARLGSGAEGLAEAEAAHRAARTAEALHSGIRHSCAVLRNGHAPWALPCLSRRWLGCWASGPCPASSS